MWGEKGEVGLYWGESGGRRVWERFCVWRGYEVEEDEELFGGEGIGRVERRCRFEDGRREKGMGSKG